MYQSRGQVEGSVGVRAGSCPGFIDIAWYEPEDSYTANKKNPIDVSC